MELKEGGDDVSEITNQPIASPCGGYNLNIPPPVSGMMFSVDPRHGLIENQDTKLPASAGTPFGSRCNSELASPPVHVS